MEEIKGYVHSIESFGSADGPGVRFIVFLAGCGLRCQFCHNPDTWDRNKGKERTAEDLIKQALRYKSYWGADGGITVSGGEPLLQIDFLIDLLKKCKAAGIHTTIDTAGAPFSRSEPMFGKIEELMKYTDLVMLDIKHIDNEIHKTYIGAPNDNILDFARYLDEIGKPVWIRHVLVPERSDYDEYLDKIKAFVDTLSNVERVEVLPYHTLGVFKWKDLGLEYPLGDIKPPTPERLKNAKDKLEFIK